MAEDQETNNQPSNDSRNECQWCKTEVTVEQCCCMRHPLTEKIMDDNPFECILDHPELIHMYKRESVKAILKLTKKNTPGIFNSEKEKNKLYYREAMKNVRSWFAADSECLKTQNMPCCVLAKINDEHPFGFDHTCEWCSDQTKSNTCCCEVHPLTKHHRNENRDCIIEDPKVESVYKETSVRAILVSQKNDFLDCNASNADKHRLFRSTASKTISTIFDQPQNENLPCCVERMLNDEYPETSHTINEEHTNGIFVVINQTRRRKGTKKDVDKLRGISTDLGFSFYLIQNQTCQEIKESLRNQLQRARKEHQCFICAILSHGSANHVLLDADENLYNLGDLTSLIVDNNHLDGLQKLIFVQACRGDKKDSFLIEDPGQKDLLLCFAVIHGEPAFRTESGSYFIQCLDKCLRNSNRLEIMQVVTKINKMMSDTLEGYTASSSTWLTKEVRLTLGNEATVRLDSYKYEQERNLFLIIADKKKHTKDTECLKQLSKLWGFKQREVIILNNEHYSCDPKKAKIDEKSDNPVVSKVGKLIKKSNLEQNRCFVCSILSEDVQGNKFRLEHEGEAYNLKDVVKLFHGSLREKPKLFFVQKFQQRSRKENTPDASVILHPEADTMITFSSAGKGQNGGSHFFEALLSATQEEPDGRSNLFKVLTKARAKMAELKEPVPWTRTQLRYEVEFPVGQRSNLQQP